MNIKITLAALVVASAASAVRASSLPEDYERVKYIESSGTQYIDTEVEPDATTIVTVDWLSLKAEGENFQVIAGTKDANSTPNQMVALIGSSNNLQGGVLCASGAMSPDEVIWNQNARHTVTLDAVANAILVDGKKVKQTTPTATSLPSIYLFARHSPTAGAENFASGFLYGCKITKGGELVRDYVPCRRKTDGEFGLYDLNGGGFCGNTGTGAFGGCDFDRFFLRVKGVASSAGAYVDAMILPEGRVPQVDLTYRFTEIDASQSSYVFGCYNNTTKTGTAIGYQSDPFLHRYRVYDKFCDGIAPTTSVQSVTLNGPDGTQVNGEVVSTEVRNVRDEGAERYYVFARHYGDQAGWDGWAQYFANAIVFALKISMDGEPVRDFVPCVRRRDGAAGFYDRVDGLFFGNSGAGLLCPVEDESSVTVLPYLESDGEQYIDTGVEPDATTIVTVDWLSLKAEGEDFQVIVGTRDTNSTPSQITAGIGKLNNLQGGVLCASGAMSPDEVIWNQNARHTVTLDAVANAILVDGKKVKQTTPTATSLPSIYLFARHSPTAGAEWFASGQLYHCTIRKGGVLVRDYVAARRKVDGALGLYDRVFGMFTRNEGTGKFLAPYMASEMRRLRYVESSGTQYIDTKVEPDTTTIVTADWKSLKAEGERFQVIVGTKDANSNPNQMVALIGTSNNLQGGVLCAGGAMTPDEVIWARNARHTVTLDAVANAILVDGKKVKQTTPTATSLPSIYLFARHSPTAGAENFAVGRLYRCTISKGGAPVLDLLPVKCKYDGCVGLWDRVSGKFYAPEGGELTAGPEIGGLVISIQ